MTPEQKEQIRQKLQAKAFDVGEYDPYQEEPLDTAEAIYRITRHHTNSPEHAVNPLDKTIDAKECDKKNMEILSKWGKTERFWDKVKNRLLGRTR